MLDGEQCLRDAVEVEGIKKPEGRASVHVQSAWKGHFAGTPEGTAVGGWAGKQGRQMEVRRRQGW